MKKYQINAYPDLKKACIRTKEEIPTIEAELFLSPEVISWAHGKNYFVRTYGCQANVRDSENIAGILESIGLVPTLDVFQAHVVILNTCAIREGAEDKVFGEIGHLKPLYNLKNINERIIGVCGCMAQEEHVVEKIMSKYPQVNLIFGTHNICDLAILLSDIITKNIRVVDVASKEGEVIENLPSVRLDKVKASVNIMFGCDKFCTYCIVPYTRGKQRSRSQESVVKEVEELITQGYQEVTLLGQNVNAYGKDRCDGASFPLLLEAVAKTGIPRLRFMTSHPWDFFEETFLIMAKYKNIMPSVHLPLQSGNDKVLARMGRRYTRASYLALVKKIRETIPHVGLTTDIIVAFPGESEEEFNDTLSLTNEVGFDNAFTFIYSPRIGTPAARMENLLSEEVKHARLQKLIDLCAVHATRIALDYVGQTVKVLLDSISKKEKTILTGYTETMKVVHVVGDENLIGTIVDVLIEESHTYSLMGKIV